jgi:hypothetical protein
MDFFSKIHKLVVPVKLGYIKYYSYNLTLVYCTLSCTDINKSKS